MCWLACLDILINAPNVQNNSSGSHVGDEAWPVLTPLFSRCMCRGGGAWEFHNVFNVQFQTAWGHKSSGPAF